MKASYLDAKGVRRDRRPRFYDADKAVIEVTPDLEIWQGSELRLGYTISAYHNANGFGISLWLDAVQVINLVSGNRDADFYGFERDENGYKHNNVQTWNSPEDIQNFIPVEVGEDKVPF
jgi:hypothetical protein